MEITLGVGTFGDVAVDANGLPVAQDQTLRDVVEQAVLADEVGINFIGLGEHHRPDFAISAPEMVLATIAGRTKNIRLGTAVTVLSTDDPVRVFERFSTLNALSNGRAEPIVGRGSFTESYPLFGYDLNDYDILFEEKLDLFAKLVRQPKVTWSGKTRTGLRDQAVYPPLGPEGMPVWVGVGGSPESVVRVARQDLHMKLAIIGGDPRRFAPYVDLYQRACAQFGNTPKPIGVHSPGFVAETDEEAREILWPHYATMVGRLGRERGWSPVTKESFLSEIASGSLYVGSPETVAKKIASTIKALGLQRFEMKYVTGPVPHSDLMNCLRLYGTKVMPMVRELVAK
ncbi:LLM class flavin-dependent oxidoreductase [Xinfangfangia sp. CPCC 101601]|uniref:LLM class flavin-dependent oxidoreductase n=1 Tax=Pseudogemmobacter lacusdianii TaxID=3069608 RepID=A0ABU0VXQ3_9RHOB|nr:LLM class flavin-dependent oxidoreductase [Xinfangfangia sp. CPCC 101601]MDQ2066513.1 LLM class flavin-dependent oxidoreductase [Xinfangfangia sp. CPCC 101601]